VTGKPLAALAALAVLSGCGSLAMQEDGPARVEAALKAYSASTLAMDVDKLAASFTEDGELQDRDREPVKGRAAIRTHLKSLEGAKVLENEVTGSWLQLVGASALQSGTFRQKSRLADGTVVESKGTFEAEWERQPDGSWLLARMTTNPPPFEPTTAGAVP
jgi:ketosteroid isomerase-like protein